MIREPHKHLFYELKDNKPPTVFVDNNYGYIAYVPITGGYKNTSLRYSNIKEVAGLNVYCSSESIGVCIFKNDTMFSCVDMEMSDFFEISVPPSASVSVLYATRISLTHAIITAVVNINPALNDVVFASKVFVLDGARISIPTRISPERITSTETDNYALLYNEDGSYTGQPISDRFITFEGYNDSTGFGSVGIENISFTEGTDSAMLVMTDLAIRDIISVYPELSALRVENAYSIKSMVAEDGVLFFIGMSTTKLFSVRVEDNNYAYSEWIFATGTEQEKFDNVLSQPIEIIPVYRKGLMSDYRLTYTPMGLTVEPAKFNTVVLTRPEKDENDNNILSEYIIPTGRDENDKVQLRPNINENGIIRPTSSVRTDVGAISSKYTFGLSLLSINPSAYMATDIAARNFGTIHYLSVSGTIPGQEDDILTVKSMCSFTPYQ
jgi:hypothetical protein